MSELSQPKERIFSIEDLTESELNFIVNAVFGVQIQSKDAKLVGALQDKLVHILTDATPPEAVIETAVV